jgi:hypothetical protein
MRRWARPFLHRTRYKIPLIICRTSSLVFACCNRGIIVPTSGSYSSVFVSKLIPTGAAANRRFESASKSALYSRRTAFLFCASVSLVMKIFSCIDDETLAAFGRTRTVSVRIASCLAEKYAKSHNFERRCRQFHEH